MNVMTVMQPTPDPPLGAVSWNMNTSCNYRCSYCTQRFMDDRGRWARDVPRFLAAFARLPGAWEIKLSGGEPFVHPHFLELVEGLATRGLRVSVVTNFSADRDRLRAFLAAAGAQLNVVSASLHLEYIDDDARADFIARGQLVQAQLPPGASFNVTCVATRAALPQLPGLRAEFAAAGLTFKIQPEKQDRDVIAYSDAERAQLIALGGHNATGAIAHDFSGRPCWAGARYLIVDDLGNAYRCYPARRYRKEFLGNLLDGSFALRREAAPCLYRYCNCTVPIERGMMPRNPAPEAPAP